MKKLLFSVFTVLTLAMCTSCQNDVDVETYYFKVYANEWSTNENYGYYYKECFLPELTKGVIERGMMTAYLIDADGYDNPLPYLLPRYDEATGQYYWENIRYDLCAGKITFILQDSDFYTGEMDFENPYKFKVCIAVEH